MSFITFYFPPTVLYLNSFNFFSFQVQEGSYLGSHTCSNTKAHLHSAPYTFSEGLETLFPPCSCLRPVCSHHTGWGSSAVSSAARFPVCVAHSIKTHNVNTLAKYEPTKPQQDPILLGSTTLRPGGPLSQSIKGPGERQEAQGTATWYQSGVEGPCNIRG